MNIEQEVRLEEQALAGQAAEDALPIVSRVFAEMRNEIYRDMEKSDADLRMIQAKLLVMRTVEERLGAYSRAGYMAVKDLNK